MRPLTLIKRFLNRYLFAGNYAGRISLHLANSSETALFSKSFSEEEIQDLKNRDDFAALVDDYVNVIKEYCDDEDEDEDSDGFILRATLEDGTEVASPPMRPKSSKNIEKALLAQTHRHLEKVLDVNHKMVESVMKHGTTQMYHARQISEEGNETRIRLLKTEQDLADRSHERMLEAKKDEQAAEFRSAIMKGLTACAPVLAGKIAGIMPLGAEAVRASPHYQSLKAIFEGVPQEHWPAMNAWLQSCPLPDAEKTALNHVVDSIMNDMIESETEKTNGKAEPTVRH